MTLNGNCRRWMPGSEPKTRPPCGSPAATRRRGDRANAIDGTDSASRPLRGRLGRAEGVQFQQPREDIVVDHAGVPPAGGEDNVVKCPGTRRTAPSSPPCATSPRTPQDSPALPFATASIAAILPRPARMGKGKDGAYFNLYAPSAIIYTPLRFTLVRPVRIGQWQWSLPPLLGNRPKSDSALMTPADKPVSRGTVVTAFRRYVSVCCALRRRLCLARLFAVSPLDASSVGHASPVRSRP